MKITASSGIARLRVAVAGLFIMALAACATPFNANVSRFQSQLPAPAGQTFAVVAEDPRMAGGIEFSQYASIVTGNMARLGYAPVRDPAQADLIVRFDYGIDTGRTRVTSTGFGDPFWGGWYGGGFGGYGRFGYGGGFGRFGGYGGGFGGGWRYGWYDPFFDNGIESYTVYTSGIDMKIVRRVDGRRLFEGKAQAVSTSNRLQYLVPNLVQAMFTNFPGNSGETVRITVAPEKK